MSGEGMELKYIKEAFDTNWVVPLGPNVNGFEKDLEAFVNEVADGKDRLEKRVVALSSGTAAVHLGLIAAGVGRDLPVCGPGRCPGAGRCSGTGGRAVRAGRWRLRGKGAGP